MEYTINKTNFSKKKTKRLCILFDNGDYVSVDGTELESLSVNTYDRLVRHNKGFCAVAESGVIEFTIKGQNPDKYSWDFLYDPQEFFENRKEYIEQRCLKENGIAGIRFYDKLNWHHDLLGSFQVEKKGNILRLVVLPQPQMGGAASAENKIRLGDVCPDDVRRIDLDFENCEGFPVYDDEIKEINLLFEKNLVWGSSEFNRKLKGGYIRLKLKKRFNSRRSYFLSDKKDLKRKDFERRLCGREGFSTHDICHLYICFYHISSCDALTECIEVDEIKPSNEVDRFIKKEENDDGFYYEFESGYAQKLKDGTIFLTFGSDAKKLMKELCKHKN